MTPLENFNRYVLQQQAVGAAIVGVRNSQHTQDSASAFAFELDEADLGAIQGVLAKAEGPAGDIYGYERGLN